MKVSRRNLFKIAGGAACVFAMLPRAAFAARNNLRGLRTGVQPGNKTRLVIETSARPSYTLSYPENPARIVVSVANMAVNNNVKPNLATGTLVKSISQAQVADRLLVTAELTKRVAEIPRSGIMILEPSGDNGFRLVFDFAATAGAAAATAGKDGAKPGKQNSRKPIIVIDPGHGGRDPGAIGRSGVREKDVVLAVSRKLRAALNSAGFTAHLTRDRDIFLNLDTRAGIAEKRKADLFISLHANANPSRDVRGFSIYTLSQKASDQEAAKLAEAENAADKIDVDGFSGFEKNVRRILSSLQQNMLAEYSVEFAHTAHKKLKAAGIPEQSKKSVRSAPFAVLRSATPSALIELGHLSHREEEKLLNTGAHQDKLVAAMVRAIQDHNFEM
ncbi:MAG: N-acetylmuramoyl-L-alanine amidase [Alphaproteobacteria bacterium]|nr:N-acetylmuramoyl-L-alanine amidase [Alphaproteobacteria bacterium]